MASRAAESTTGVSSSNILQKLIQRTIEKEELLDIGIFHKGFDIEEHVYRVENKVTDLNMDDQGHIKFLMKTLHSDVQNELKSYLEYKQTNKRKLLRMDKKQTVADFFYKRSQGE